MNPELRLIRYFLAVAEEGNVTRAAERLHISQPSVSAAIKQLEAQLGVELLQRRGRGVILTPAGTTLHDRGTELLHQFETVMAEVRSRGDAPTGRLRLGHSPAARQVIVPELLEVCATAAPGAMLYTSEHTTGELLRELSAGRLDLAVIYCAPRDTPPGIELLHLREDPAAVHMAAEHPLATRATISLAELGSETIIVGATADSAGFTERVLSAFAAVGVTPRTREDPYPDLGLQAARERLGVSVSARSVFPSQREGWAFVPIEPPVYLPYHLAWHTRSRSVALDTVLAAARELASRSAPRESP